MTSITGAATCMRSSMALSPSPLSITIVQPASRGFRSRSRTGTSMTPSHAGRAPRSLSVIQQALHAVARPAERAPGALHRRAIQEPVHRPEPGGHELRGVQRPDGEAVVEEHRAPVLLAGVVEEDPDELLAAIEPGHD